MRDKERLRVPMGKDREYAELWRVVDAAVYDAIRHHPEYLHDRIRRRTVRESISKRVVGSIKALLNERRAREGRQGNRLGPNGDPPVVP